MQINNALSGSISNSISKIQHQCTWQLEVTYTDSATKEEKTRIVGYPLTVEYNITRNTFASANTANFSIYNLSPATRQSEAFFQDRFCTDQVKYVTFKAGYNGNLVTCFRGYILESYTKHGNTDVITSMKCLDLGTPQAQMINVTFEAGTSKKEAYKSIVQNCEGLRLGYIGTLEGTFKSAVTFYGDPLTVLNEITEGHTFIDNGVVHTIQNNESLDIGVTVLTSESGLIETPTRHEAQIVVTSLFNPSIQVGQLLEIKDPVFETFNGTYVVCGFTHNGTISGAVAGTRTTTINLLIGAYLDNSSYNITDTTEKQVFAKVKGENVEVVSGTLESGARGIYNYIKKHNGAIPNVKLTQNISAREMLGNDNTNADRMKELTIEIVSNCITIAKKLQAYIDTNTPAQQITIMSGWRSNRVNNSLGNASKESAHKRGLAIDFRYKNINTYTAFKYKYNKTWDKFTYMFRGSRSKSPTIHVQATLGAGGARRARKSIV